MGFAQAMPSLLRTPHLVFRSPDRPRLLLLHHGLDLLVPGVISTVQGDGGCEEGADVTPAPPVYALRPRPRRTALPTPAPVKRCPLCFWSFCACAYRRRLLRREAGASHSRRAFRAGRLSGTQKITMG